mgnify:FL=1
MSSSPRSADRPCGSGAPRWHSAASAIGALIGFHTSLQYFWPALIDNERSLTRVAPVVVVGALAGGTLPVVRQALRRPGECSALLAAVLLVTFLCVPETDQYRVAAIVPGLLLVGELVTRRQAVLAWYGVAGYTVAWASVFGAYPRASAIVGALFAWWPFVLPGLLRLRGRTSDGTRGVALVSLAAAVIVARTGALSPDVTDAFLAVGMAVTASVAVSLGWIVLVRRSIQRHAD